MIYSFFQESVSGIAVQFVRSADFHIYDFGSGFFTELPSDPYKMANSRSGVYQNYYSVDIPDNQAGGYYDLLLYHANSGQFHANGSGVIKTIINVLPTVILDNVPTSTFSERKGVVEGTKVNRTVVYAAGRSTEAR